MILQSRLVTMKLLSCNKSLLLSVSSILLLSKYGNFQVIVIPKPPRICLFNPFSRVFRVSLLLHFYVHTLVHAGRSTLVSVPLVTGSKTLCHYIKIILIVIDNTTSIHHLNQKISEYPNEKKHLKKTKIPVSREICISQTLKYKHI